ncbi:MAG: hypothetical protein ACOYMG_17030, partial [Candidatus Methylumidiphilus sp.]
AQFKTVSGPAYTVVAHFNPASLQYTVSNTLKEEGKGSKKKQYITKTSAKLTMDLVFDTTDTGEDVRNFTDQMAKLLQPISEGKDKLVPPNVEFGWGLYRFVGMVEQYKETIDFFAPGGVPLRSSVNLTLASQDVVFDSAKNPPAKVDGDSLTPKRVVVPNRSGPAGLANALGDPRSARAIASLNASASLRFGGDGELALGGGVNLQAAAAFSVGGGIGGGLSLGGGIGGGIGGGVGIGGGIGGGVGIGGGIGGGIGIGGGVGIGASASAGFSAGASGSASAFAGLRSDASTSLAVPDGRELLSGSIGSGGGAGAQFGLGGQAQLQAGASLNADVGLDAKLTGRITFS